MIDHGAEAMAKIDAGLAWLPDEPPTPETKGRCWRCTVFCCGDLRPSGLCPACYAYMTCATDEDPKDDMRPWWYRPPMDNG